MAISGFESFMGMLTNSFNGSGKGRINGNLGSHSRENGLFDFGGKGNGGFDFGFGSKNDGGSGKKQNGIFGFGFGSNENGQVKGNSDGGLIGSIISAIKGILGQYFNIAKGLITGRSWAETVRHYNLETICSIFKVQSIVQTGISNFFGTFGGLALSSQEGIAKMLANSLEVFITILKCESFK